MISLPYLLSLLIFSFICKHTQNIYSLTLFFFINTLNMSFYPACWAPLSLISSQFLIILLTTICFMALKIFSLPLSFSNLTMFNCGFLCLYYLSLYYLGFMSICDLLDSIFHQIWQVLAITSSFLFSFFCFFYYLLVGDRRQLGFIAGMCHIVSSLFFSLFPIVKIGYF